MNFICVSVDSASSSKLAVTVPAPTTPETWVPGDITTLPLIGDPIVGAVPSKAIWNEPLSVLNLEVMLAFEPLLNTLKVGEPMSEPV